MLKKVEACGKNLSNSCDNSEIFLPQAITFFSILEFFYECIPKAQHRHRYRQDTFLFWTGRSKNRISSAKIIISYARQHLLSSITYIYRYLNKFLNKLKVWIQNRKILKNSRRLEKFGILENLETSRSPYRYETCLESRPRDENLFLSRPVSIELCLAKPYFLRPITQRLR